MFWDSKIEISLLKTVFAVAEPETPEALATPTTAEYLSAHKQPTSDYLVLSPPQQGIKSGQSFLFFPSAEECWKGTILAMDGLTQSEVI